MPSRLRLPQLVAPQRRSVTGRKSPKERGEPETATYSAAIVKFAPIRNPDIEKRSGGEREDQDDKHGQSLGDRQHRQSRRREDETEKPHLRAVRRRCLYGHRSGGSSKDCRLAKTD